MNRPAVLCSFALVLVLSGTPVPAQRGELQVEIQNLPRELLLTNSEDRTDVEGRASVFGGLKQLDLFMVLDASRSLIRTDPQDFRTQAAVALVEHLPERSDIRIGLIDFNYTAHLMADLTHDRAGVAGELDEVVRDGGTNLADGILTAVDGFERLARPEAARIMLLFTDGKSDAKEALAATDVARSKGVVIHSILLGDRKKSETLLRTIAESTGGNFVYIENPEDLPQAFLDLRTTGVEHVKLSVNGSAPIDTELIAGSFSGSVPLREGRNRITATATDLEGGTATDTVEVTVTGPLRVVIASPVDGTLYRELETDTPVEVNATVFSELSDVLRTEFPTLGVENVVISAKGSPPIPTEFEDGRFAARAPLDLQDNRITATATSFDGRVGEAFVDVTVRPPGCSGLRVYAERNGRPAISLVDRGLEIIFDASNSMWGRIGGQPKISIAKDTLRQVMSGFPEDFFVALRVYGHQYSRELKNCTDSELLIPLGLANASRIRAVVGGFQPKGMTPLGYSIAQVPGDFGDFTGDRVVVLVTDGIESCDGDPVGEAARLQTHDKRWPIHVIGFALSDSADVAVDSLRNIASTTGGRFFLAGSGEELRRALMQTAGTPYGVWRDQTLVAEGTFGVDERFSLPGGNYVLRVEGDPPRDFEFTLGDEEEMTLTISKTGNVVLPRETRRPAPYQLCE